MAGGRPDPSALGYRLRTAPSVAAVSLAAARLWCRVDSDDVSQDATIEFLVAAATDYAETYTGRSLMQQGWTASASAFPGDSFWQGCRYGGPSWSGSSASYDSAQEWQLLHGPVVSIDAVRYLDTASVSQVLDPTTYVLDQGGLFPRLAPSAGYVWPATMAQLGAVQIDFTAGYGTTEDDVKVPAMIRHWLRMRVSSAFEHRGEFEMIERGAKLEPNPYVDSMLDAYRVPSV